MSIEKTKPVGSSALPSTEQVTEQKKESRPNMIGRLADLQEASGALENLKKGVQNTGIAAGHADHNDSHADHSDGTPKERTPREPRDR